MAASAFPTTTATPVVHHTAYYAVSECGTWGYERLDIRTTPWQVTHLPTGTDCGWHPTLDRARVATADGSALAEVPAPVVAPEPCRPSITSHRAARPVAKGHQLDMSESQARSIVEAGTAGHIVRGAPMVDGMPTGRLTDTQIRALAARGWVTPTTKTVGRRVIVTGCDPTDAGVEYACEILAQTNTVAA